MPKIMVSGLPLWSIGAWNAPGADAVAPPAPDEEAGAALSVRLEETAGQLRLLEQALEKLEAQRSELARQMTELDSRWKAAHSGAPQQPGTMAKAVVPPPLGSAEFTPGGFVDFGGIFRSTNVGSGTGTAFGSIPLHHSSQGMLSESGSARKPHA